MPNRPPHIMDTPAQEEDEPHRVPVSGCPLSSDPDSILRRLERKIDNLDYLIRGPSDKPSHGVVYRLDMIEKTLAGYAKLVWAVVLALVAVIVHAIFRKP